MAEEIRGLSVKFDADFSSFKKGMKNAEKDINSTQKQLKTLQNSLNLKWDPSKFKQAQKQAQNAIEATEKKAQLLRDRLAAMETAGVTDKTRAEYNYLSEQLNRTELDAQRLHQQLEDLNGIKLQNLTNGLDKAAKATKGLSIAAGAALAGLTATGLKTIEEADEIATLATKYNMTTDAIQQFNYVALQTDTSAEALYKGFTKVQAGVADLKTGVESVATKALAELNLSFDQFDGSEEQFYAIIDALSKMEDQAKMVSVANDIFGEKMAVELLPLIYAGTDAVNEYREEWENTGALSEEQVKKLAEFDNVLNELKTTLQNIVLQLGSELLPVMESVAGIVSNDLVPAVRKLVEWFSQLDDKQKKILASALLLLTALSPVLKTLSSILTILPAMIHGFTSLSSVFSAISKHPIVLILGLIAALLLLLYTRNEEFRKSTDELLSLLTRMGAPVLDTITKSLENIFSLLSPIIELLGNQLAPLISFLCYLLEPVVRILEYIFSLVDKIMDGLFMIFGKGTLWGKDTDISVNETSSSSTDLNTLLGDLNIPQVDSSGTSYSTSTSNYVDNSNIVINIEKNDYMTEEDIINAVNKGLRQKMQARK